MFVIEDGLFSIESASQGERVNEDVGKTRRCCQSRIQTPIPTLCGWIAILDGCRHIGDKIRLIGGNCWMLFVAGRIILDVVGMIWQLKVGVEADLSLIDWLIAYRGLHVQSHCPCHGGCVSPGMRSFCVKLVLSLRIAFHWVSLGLERKRNVNGERR